MATLNHGKVIRGLEKALQAPHESFFFELLRAYDVSATTIKRLQMANSGRNVATIAGDWALSQEIYFRAVPQGTDLAGQLAELKGLKVVAAHKIRFLLVTDFQTILLCDRKVDDTLFCELDELQSSYEFLLPLTGKYEKAVLGSEHPADVKACVKMARLYDAIRRSNGYASDQDLHALNLFLTRLIFCFFAEDTGIFPKANQLTAALDFLTLQDGSDTQGFFQDLFTLLNLGEQDKRREQYCQTLREFPYVNGNLFASVGTIPQFNKKTRRLLVECGEICWKDISPAIFGSMFQAVLNPEERRMLGAHYTSEQNIFKVIRPLFLEELESEFEALLDEKGSAQTKARKLRKFQEKLGSLGFLDPACGSGNFLIVAYRELRRLEARVIRELQTLSQLDAQGSLDVSSLVKVRLNQFYGIELLDFPVDIARISLHLMEHVMNLELGKTCGLTPPSLPLHDCGNIVCANALTTDWQDIVPQDKISYIFGNPPFGGARFMTGTQKEELMAVFQGVHGAGDLDYVTCWFKKAADYILGSPIQVAFVATNSICQGTHVSILWKHLHAQGMHIRFAYRTFQWKNAASHSAAVHCVIVGFGTDNPAIKYLFGADNSRTVCRNINGYLLDADDIFVESREHPLCAVPEIGIGCQPIDGGHYLFTAAEKADFLTREPGSARFFRTWLGADEFINCWRRYCLWLGDATEEDLASLPECRKRVELVRQYRAKSSRASTKRLADTPRRFQVENMPSGSYIVIPQVSSERRAYIPIGFIHTNTLCSDKLRLLPVASPFYFGILTSRIHMVWVRAVCCRLKSDYSYTNKLVYNNFPWPDATEDQQQTISDLVLLVLDTREEHPDMSLGQMYNPETMPEDLREAHAKLDAAVDRLYSPKGFASDEERLQALFACYEALTQSSEQEGRG